MRKLSGILLLGLLSMFFGEVFAGSSQVWFFDPWSLIVTFPLYLAHVLFFLYLANRFDKMSFTQLYLFGVVFGLYESWITKVLWSGYLNEAGPGMGTFLGLGVSEFFALLFWHPIMSFIVPILVYQVLSGGKISVHEKLFKKTKKKTSILYLFMILVAAFSASGNSDILSLDLALIGSLVLIFVAYFLSFHKKIDKILPSRKGFFIISAYLIVLYILAFFFLAPERLPKEAIAYVSVIILYFISIMLLIISGRKKMSIKSFNKQDYGRFDLIKLLIAYLIFANIYIILLPIGTVVLWISYVSIMVLGAILLLLNILRVLLHKV
ncbi:hypothetical protein C0585_03480 [Candidatus Woesearchaeota archaeon]|nr:MAG: hypothetical protein C0585_03480 [Candidatus Woesearchaeota archaeon]